MLGNFLRDLISIQKQCLYRYYVLPIALYNFQLWYYNKAPLTYPLQELRKMQKRASLWILSIFCTFLSVRIEAIVGLMFIYLHLQKLSRRFHLRAYSLLANYIIKLILEARPSDNIKSHLLFLDKPILK